VDHGEVRILSSFSERLAKLYSTQLISKQSFPEGAASNGRAWQGYEMDDCTRAQTGILEETVAQRKQLICTFVASYQRASILPQRRQRACWLKLRGNIFRDKDLSPNHITWIQFIFSGSG
jgi:hypothetical protein